MMFQRSSTLSLAFSFPLSEGVFMSVVVDMNEVSCFNVGSKRKLNTQTISIGIVYIIVCNSLMLFLPHSHYISIGCYMVAVGCVHYSITIAVISPLYLWQRRSIADS